MNIGSSAAAPDQDRQSVQEEAWRQIQARYGEKPKEARPVKKTLDKDDFLKIMIMEMKNQDPTKPMDSDKMATQMAQMTSVEQLQNLGKAMDKMAEKSNITDRMAMSAMIGQTVTVDKGKFSHQKGTISPVSFNLPENAEKVKLTIVDEVGETVFTRELEPRKKGPNSFNWDGMMDTGNRARAGNYMVRVEAETETGKKLKIDPIAKERIQGISFEGGQSLFLVGDLKNPQKVPFNSVIRMEGQSQAVQQSASKPEAKVAEPESAGGRGLQNADEVNSNESASAQEGTNVPFALPAAVQEKLKQDLAQKSEGAEQSSTPQGFPSGLKEETPTTLSQKDEGSLGIPGVRNESVKGVSP